MKVLLNCILKLENRYLDEWINHYIKLGVDKIVIYDNNDLNGKYAENIRDIKAVSNGIKSGLIDVYSIPAPQPIGIQVNVYEECYEKYGNSYDWIMNFDIDEYLILEKFDNIHDYLKQDKFKNFDLIHLNWKLFDDNDIIKSPKKYSVVKTYTRELTDILPNRFCLNNEMKSIIRGGLKDLQFRNSHTVKGCHKSCNALGIEDNANTFVSSYPLHKGAWLNHYITKSLDEYINLKMARQETGDGVVCNPTRVNYAFYFMYNELNDKKLKYLKTYIKDLKEIEFKNEITKSLTSHYELLKNEQQYYYNNDNIDLNVISNVLNKNQLIFTNNVKQDRPKVEDYDINKLIFK